MIKQCLYCYRELNGKGDYHKKCSQAFFGTELPPSLDYSLDEMAELAKAVIQRSIAVPGVQPKLSLTLLRNELNAEQARLTVVGALGGNYIFKPPSLSYPSMPENEHVTMRMAEDYGIPVVKSSLIRLATGELGYITKRIDRTSTGQKIHMLDMFQILEAVDKYRGSIEGIGRAIGTYSENTQLDKLYFFELTLFSFFTGNSDMHLKNFSMINADSGWTLSPAYDLLNVKIANPADNEELALTLNGKKRKLNRSHFDYLAEKLQLTKRQTERAYSRVQKNKHVAQEWIKRSFLPAEMKKPYLEVLEQRYATLGM